MSTKALIDRIYARIHRLPLKTEWTRHTGSLSILKLVEAAQDELLDEAKQSQIWIGNENGGFPLYLKTQNNINRYDIIPANLSKGAAVNEEGPFLPILKSLWSTHTHLPMLYAIYATAITLSV